MCKAVFILLLLTATGFCAKGAGFTLAGHWEGAVTRLGSVQVVHLDFAQVGSAWQATCDNPECGLYRDPVDSVIVEGLKLTARIPRFGRFEMLLDSDYQEITGSNTNWKPPVQIHVKRVLRQPDPFRSQEVQFTSGKIKLVGTLYLPLAKGPYAAVVFIHGSDSTTRGDSWYRSQAEILAGHGYASLVYDKRGCGASSGRMSTASLQDFADDALAAVSLLKSHRDIRKDHIGIYGGSQGGWIAPLAAMRSKDVAFLILQSAPAVTPAEQEKQSVAHRMRRDELDSADVAAAVRYTAQWLDVALTEKGWSDLQLAMREARLQKWAQYVQFADSMSELQWYRDNNLDPIPVLSKVGVPVLALYGENDPYVPPSENAAKLLSALTSSGKTDVTVKVFPQADHALVRWQTLRTGEWQWPQGYWAWSRKAPGYYETVFDWLDLHTRN